MIQCLDLFCAASGAKVSSSKTKIYLSKNANPALSEALCRISGFEITTNLGNYLGTPIMEGRMSGKIFDPVIDCVRSRLLGWSASTLSLAGRVVLI